MKSIGCLVLLFSMAALVHAQDSVTRLADSKRIRGEIIAENESVVMIITQLGERLAIKRKDIRKMRRGRPMSKVVKARLQAIDQKDPGKVFAIAEWAFPRSSLKRDAKRLARRVLVIDPEHKAARKMLGHALGAGLWHESEAAADRAILAFFTAEGRVKFNAGWVLESDLPYIKANPGKWMLVDERWHRTHDVMTKKGFTSWNNDWIPPEEKDLIPIAKSILERSEIATHIAQVGPDRVWHFAGRLEAIEIAKVAGRVRKWASETFSVTWCLTSPVSNHVVLKTADDFKLFLDRNQDVHGLSKSSIARSSEILGFLPYYEDYGYLGGVLRLRGGKEVRNLLVWNMSRNLTANCWAGRASRLPFWIGRAASAHAEIAVIGFSNVTEYQKSKYDRTNKHQLKDGTHEAARANVLEDLKAQKRITIHELFGATRTTFSNRHLTWATVYLSYLLKERKPEFLLYLRDVEKKLDKGKRFSKHFGETFEDMQPKFEKWLLRDG